MRDMKIRRSDVIINKAADEKATYYVICADVDCLLKNKKTGKCLPQVAIKTIHSMGDVMKQIQAYEIVEDQAQ